MHPPSLKSWTLLLILLLPMSVLADDPAITRTEATASLPQPTVDAWIGAQMSAMRQLEAEGIELADMDVFGNTIRVQGDIRFAIDDLSSRACEMAARDTKGRRARWGIIAPQYRGNIVLVIHPDLEANWGSALRSAAKRWSTAHIRLPGRRYQRTSLRITPGFWGSREYYLNRIEAVPGSTWEADFPQAGRPGREIRLVPGGAEEDLAEWGTATHEMGHALGFWHSDDRSYPSRHISGTADWWQDGPYESIMIQGGIQEPFSAQDHLSAVKLYPGPITSSPPAF